MYVFENNYAKNCIIGTRKQQKTREEALSMKERLSMKEILKQLVNYVLVLAMLCSLLPIMGTKVYAESTNTMSVEKFTGNTIVRKGTKVVPRENHKLTVYSYPAGGRYIEVRCDSWIADDDYMVVNKWGNNSAHDDYIELSGKLVTITNPKADLESGTYTENKILTLSAAQELEDIYYTTDGSEPTIESTKYTNPISITGEEGTVKTIVIKARVIRQSCCTPLSLTYN